MPGVGDAVYGVRETRSDGPLGRMGPRCVDGLVQRLLARAGTRNPRTDALDGPLGFGPVTRGVYVTMKTSSACPAGMPRLACRMISFHRNPPTSGRPAATAGVVPRDW